MGIIISQWQFDEPPTVERVAEAFQQRYAGAVETRLEHFKWPYERNGQPCHSATLNTAYGYLEISHNEPGPMLIRYETRH